MEAGRWGGRSVALAVVASSATALGLGGFGWMDFRLGARVAGATVPSVAPPVAGGVRAEGRVVSYPGAEVVVGTDVGGTIVTLDVKENDVIRKGDLVAGFAADEPRAALAEAQARLQQAQVDATYLESEEQRTETLVERGALPAQALQRAKHERDAAVAARSSAVATAARFAVALRKTRILAPIAGTVVAVHAHPGETVAPGAKLATLVDLERLRIEAEIDEFDAPRLRLGQPVILRVEGVSGTWNGRVEELPQTVVSRRLKPEDPSRPSDTRVLLVKVALLDRLPARLGQRIEMEFSTIAPVQEAAALGAPRP